MVVYKITNLLNGKLYVGQTRQPIEKRFLQHFYADSPLGDAMRECGIENFTIEVIEHCDTQEQLDAREKFWIRVLNCTVPNGYNRTPGGERGHGKSRKNSVDVPTKMSIAEALVRFRAEMQLSQKDILETLGIPQSSYYRYENGRSIPQADVIVKLATTYGVTTDYLLGLSDEPRPPDTAALVRAIGDCQKILSDALDVRP